MKIEFKSRKKQDPKLKKIDVSGKIPVEEKDMKKDIVYYESTAFNPRYNLSRWKIRKEAKFYKKNIHNVVLIKMELANGMFREFLVSEEGQGFKYKGGRYAFDPSLKYYMIDREIWAYDFHELLSLPLRKRFVISEQLERFLQPELDKAMRKPLRPHIDVNEIKTLIENSQLVDVENSINPTTLKRFTDSEVIKQVLQGAMLGRIFKIMFVLIIIIAIFMLILIIIQSYTSGIFEKIGGFFG